MSPRIVDSRPHEFWQRALTYAAVRHAQFLAELRDFVRFPTVSAQPRHAGDLKQCARWLARHLRRIGLRRVNVIPTRRHPLVYAEWLHAPSRPTVLIYGHYDVQPAEPLDEWRSPPFAERIFTAEARAPGLRRTAQAVATRARLDERPSFS
jgi:acetylornithine deacetylase/succinyl-diaminopimelate desuccinylase-like protein